MQACTAKNAIKQLVKDSGETLTDLDSIKAEVVNHLQSFLQTAFTNTRGITGEELSELIPYRVSNSMAGNLVRDVTSSVIMAVLQSMPANKTPGPDGYTAEFFIAAWSVIGEDFVTAIQSLSRLLLENVLLATELIKDYHKDTISARCALKLDISKAFDTVKWDFVIAILEAMAFPTVFISWIRSCITSASFSVMVNGDSSQVIGV